MHLQDIFNINELDEKSTSKEILLVHKEGNRKVKRNIIMLLLKSYNQKKSLFNKHIENYETKM